ncbi:MAG: S8 family serine peptidase [Candidatus Krumholzibacteriia bacterium]
MHHRSAASICHAKRLVLISVLLATSASAQGSLSPRLQGIWGELAPDERITAWVYLTDKGAREHMKARVPPDVVSQRSLRRRLKVRPPDQVVDATDLPVDEAYVGIIAEHVERVRQRSKWFNGVSVEATRAQLEELRALPFVREIDLVTRFRRVDPPAPPAEEVAPVPPPTPGKPTAFDYGSSLNQVQQINVVDHHTLGYDGSGVVVGHFDNGHRLLSHEVFAGMTILATWDFVDNDPDPAPDPWDPSGFGAHGILTLSVLGGFKEGDLIGPAFGATYLLARTENDASETPLEEDNWVAAMEWADSIGVDVTSTSLAYLDYDPPFPSWTWEDMDGNTTVITRASDMAAERGIVVVNSAGNSGSGPEPNTLLAPADGDSVITVGSVDSGGNRSGFSSVGPTVDGRIKPDVMAQGSGTKMALATDTTSYGNGSGTSLACPLVAGTAALLLQAHPAATPMQIRDALRSTANLSTSPDNLMGWGIIDALAAHDHLSTTDVTEPPVPTAYRLSRNFPNPFNPGTKIRYELPAPSHVTLHIYDVRGRLVRSLLATSQPARVHEVDWDGLNDGGESVGSGTYFLRMRAVGLSGSRVFIDTRKLSVIR